MHRGFGEGRRDEFAMAGVPRVGRGGGSVQRGRQCHLGEGDPAARCWAATSLPAMDPQGSSYPFYASVSSSVKGGYNKWPPSESCYENARANIRIILG